LTMHKTLSTMLGISSKTMESSESSTMTEEKKIEKA